MPKATLLSSYADKPRSFSLVIGKSVLKFDTGVPKEVSPSVAARLAKKTEEVRDFKGRKTGKTRCMFQITGMPEVKQKVEPVRKPKKSTRTKKTDTGTPPKSKSEDGEEQTEIKGQRRLL